jgi:hypothetical protein
MDHENRAPSDLSTTPASPKDILPEADGFEYVTRRAVRVAIRAIVQKSAVKIKNDVTPRRVSSLFKIQNSVVF